MDGDDSTKNVLKSAISKIVTPMEARPGETVEQLQERIMNEMITQLQTQFADAKAELSSNMTPMLEQRLTQINKAQEKMMATLNEE